MQMHIKQEQQDIPPDQPPYNPPPAAPTEIQNGYPAGVPGIHPGYQIQQQVPGMVQGTQIQQQQQIYSGAPYGIPNPITALQAQVNGGSKQDDPQKEKVKISDNQIDIESVKGKFGWTVLDGVNIPYIFRKDKKFVSVRIVEQKLLSRYPNSYPDELGKHQPLTSFFITDHEAKLLNEINVIHCGSEFGQRDFNSKDLIVLLTDFDDFYNLVKKTFPENESKSPPLPNQTSKIPNNIQHSAADDSNEMCGWIQVNNTVTPYVKRELGKFVPLSVMKYAAGLSLPEQGVLPTDEECSLLNSSCKLAGFNFNFSKTTRLISISDLTRHCSVHITPLPSVNPLQHAVYLDLPSSNASPSEQSKTSTPQQHNNNQSQQRTTAQPGGFGEQSPNSYTQFYGRPPPPYEAYSAGGHMRPPSQGGRAANKQNQDPHNTHQQNVHPAFVDPRYMFSYNRFPFNMYPMQFGPPNVTVNPQQQNGYGQMNMAPSNFSNNNNLSSQPGSRNPTPGLDNPKNRQSPARSSSVGSNGMAGNLQQQQTSSVNSHMLATSPRYEVTNNRSQIPGNDNQISPGRNSGYVVPPVNPMQNYQTIQHQRIPSGGQQSTTTPNGTFNVRQPGTQPSGNWPFVSQPGGKIPVKPNHMNGTNIAGGQNMSQGPGGGQTMPPPPVMSGPHGPGHNNGQNTPVEITGENGKQKVSPIRLATVPANPSSGNAASPDNTMTTKSNNPALVDNIKGEWLVGKSISCMHLDSSQRSGKFCLVEAVCKLYFNGCSVNEFLFALENVLKIPLVTCTDDEEKAFIHYYSLPVTVLKCNKMINFEDLEKYFPQLSYVFRDKTGTSEPHKTLAQSNVNTSPTKNTQNNHVIQNTEGSQGRNHHHPRKRPTILVGGPANKVPCKSLEETVKRLRQQTVSDTDPESNIHVEVGQDKSGGAIIILDD